MWHFMFFSFHGSYLLYIKPDPFPNPFVCLLWGPAAVRSLRLSSVKTLERLLMHSIESKWTAERTASNGSVNDMSASHARGGKTLRLPLKCCCCLTIAFELVQFLYAEGKDRWSNSFHNSPQYNFCWLLCRKHYWTWHQIWIQNDDSVEKRVKMRKSFT